ncbi:platelet-activating factor acetylhydrolase isoform X2 [Carcharodon carcharias]|uniref:platelet-activating factor acetylhydrolase isoform X2 n=1 Tax=Carcharodon carcharias TaxID=13397 RepID=UPI001B7E0DCA|nr:platelet-activating factor acetylhydrolase isoform X2 [Carcharodon carcharias]
MIFAQRLRYIVKWNMGNSGSHYPGIPSGKGPNLVGCVDLMDDLTIQGSFLRLYYPCEQGGKQQQPLWIPRHEYYYGLADFLKYNRKCVEYILNYLYGSYRVPAEWGAPFKSDGKYPLVVFSHGLGAFRTLYSAICIEVASRGFVVAAVEHRDGSASATYYFEEKTKTVNDVGESTSSTISTLPLDRLQMKWLYYKPLKEREQEFSLRNVQVHQRAEECIKALNLLTDINMGKPVHNIFPLKFDFIKMKDTLDLQKVTIMGHSFGGATVIDALSKDHRFQCGVALDAWMFPLEDEIHTKVQKPILFINSEKFQWVVNILKMKKLDSNTVQRKMITIMGTVHQSFPDFTFLTGTFFGRIFQLKGTIDPLIAIDISNKASLAFMQRHLGLEKDFDQWDPLIDGKGEHIIPGTNIHLPLTNSEPKQ